MKTVQITATTADEQIKRLYEASFPKDEQVPWGKLVRLIGDMHLDFTAYYDDEDLYRTYNDITMTIMMMGDGIFTLDDRDHITNELKRYWWPEELREENV